jgi:hypothetical protein
MLVLPASQLPEYVKKTKWGSDMDSCSLDDVKIY